MKTRKWRIKNTKSKQNSQNISMDYKYSKFLGPICKPTNAKIIITKKEKLHPKST